MPETMVLMRQNGTSKTNADTSSRTNTIADLENSVAINIDGANVTVVAGGDGIDSNGNVTVKSGSLYVTQTSADNAAIDYDGTGIISGGTVWAIGIKEWLKLSLQDPVSPIS